MVVAENKMVLPFLSHFCSLVFYYPRFGKIPDFSGVFSRSHCLRAHISARLKLPLSICIALGHSRSSAANLPARQLTYGLVHWGGGCWGCVNAHSDQQPGEQSIEQPSIHGPECRPHHVANIWRRSSAGPCPNCATRYSPIYLNTGLCPRIGNGNHWTNFLLHDHHWIKAGSLEA